jgi:hypothetical protein
VETKPKTMWSCMWNPLPNLTGSCARGANQLGVFGLVRGPLTRPYQLTLLAVDQYKIVLPIITSRGVKYTHNDIKHTVLHTDSGPTRMGLIPEASDPKKVVMQDPYVIAVNRTPQRIDAFFRFMTRWLIMANIVLGTFTLFNLVIYPRYIYEAPEPILHSPHVDTLHPHQV